MTARTTLIPALSYCAIQSLTARLLACTRCKIGGSVRPSEIKARCGEEYAKAQSAREALAALLAQGGVQIANIGSDKYEGRVVADASTRTTADVAQALINAGQVRSYDGGRRDYWCP